MIVITHATAASTIVSTAIVSGAPAVTILSIAIVSVGAIR